MKKLLILGSVVSPCPPPGYGGTERVAYYQAKQLAKRGVPLFFVGAKGTLEAFAKQLAIEGETEIEAVLRTIEFIEIGGGTQMGDTKDALHIDPTKIEASRKLRLEMVYLAQVIELLRNKKDEYDVVLNNMRGEAVLFPVVKELGKQLVNVLHLNLFPELADMCKAYNTRIIPISEAQKEEFPDLSYLPTIYNPVSPALFPFSETSKGYALMIGSIGRNKNPKDAILACKKAGVPLYLAGTIKDKTYFEEEISPLVDGKEVQFVGEVEQEEKMRLYQGASVFLFPILWQEPFGLVLIESLMCGTPVIAYPNGGPSEIVRNGENGYLVSTRDEMSEKIAQIGQISRQKCRQDAEQRFSDKIIGEQYFDVLRSL